MHRVSLTFILMSSASNTGMLCTTRVKCHRTIVHLRGKNKKRFFLKRAQNAILNNSPCEMSYLAHPVGRKRKNPDLAIALPARRVGQKKCGSQQLSETCLSIIGSLSATIREVIDFESSLCSQPTVTLANSMYGFPSIHSWSLMASFKLSLMIQLSKRHHP